MNTASGPSELGGGLNLKQRQFVYKYVQNGGNANKAATDAGYYVGSVGALMARPDVQAAILEALERREARTLITADYVLTELKKLADASIVDVIAWDSDGNARITASDDLSPKARAAVKKFKITRKRFEVNQGYGEDRRHLGDWVTEHIEVEMHDKLGALDKLAKNTGVYAKDNEQSKGNVFVDARTQIMAPVLADLTIEQQRALAMRMLPGEGETDDG